MYNPCISYLQPIPNLSVAVRSITQYHHGKNHTYPRPAELLRANRAAQAPSTSKRYIAPNSIAANPSTNETLGTKITKRPLLHPPIAPPRSGASVQKIVYISASSPFISTTKRVRKYLSEIDKRALGKIGILKSGTDRTKIQNVERGGVERAKEEVLVKATGKAIEKGLRVALYFQGQEDCLVRLRTGSVGAVDDVLVQEGLVEGEGEQEREDVPETRVRRTSMLEVGISLR